MSAGAFSIPLIVRERILDFMSWVLLAVISYTLTAGIAISDKYFLTRRMPSAVSYGFWVGVLGLGFVLAIPFGFYLPEPQTLAAAIASGATFTCALVALFWTLKRGTVSRVIPMIGAVFPVATLALAAAVVGERLSGQETVAFAVLLVSGILLSASTEESEKGRIGVTIAGSVLAGFLLALAFVLAKYVFSHHAFLSGFIWMRVAGGATALSFLLVPSWRRTILSASAKRGGGRSGGRGAGRDRGPHRGFHGRPGDHPLVRRFREPAFRRHGYARHGRGLRAARSQRDARTLRAHRRDRVVEGRG